MEHTLKPLCLRDSGPIPPQIFPSAAGFYLEVTTVRRTAQRTGHSRHTTSTSQAAVGFITDRRGIRVREITFCNPCDGAVYVYLTTEMTLEPGLLALLHKTRWEIEKVFDETKTKLAEKYPGRPRRRPRRCSRTL